MTFHRAQCRALAAAAVAAALALPATGRAQNSLEDAIKQFSATDVKGYTQPLADVLVSNLSSGYFATSAPRSKFGLSIELVGMGTTVSDKMRSYTANTPVGFQPTTFTAPTVFGGKATAVNHASISGLSYRASDGVLDATIFPTAVPQVRISGLLNSEVVVRFIDSDLLGSSYPKEDLPKLNMFGVGIRHGLNRYFKALPVDLAVSASYNSLTMGDYIDLSGTTFGANVGRTMGMLSLMGGIESSGGKMNLAYTSTNPDQTGAVAVDLTSKRQVRFNAGATLDLKIIKLFGTAGFGSFTTYAGGLRIGL